MFQVSHLCKLCIKIHVDMCYKRTFPPPPPPPPPYGYNQINMKRLSFILFNYAFVSVR
jgi:hypothetical protein